MSNENDLLLAAAACVVLADLLNDLKADDSISLNGELRCDGSFKNFARMSSADFEILINQVGHKISKKDTRFRDAIPIQERLAIILRFLATGDSYHSLMYLFKVSKQIISKIVPEVCVSLIDSIRETVQTPTSEDQWKTIADEYHHIWNFPHCVGAMDGKHISLQAPIGSGSEFFNYKGFFSIVLFAIVDARYRFIYVNVGCQGRISDGGVFASTVIPKMIQDGTLQLPKEDFFPGKNDHKMPYVFVADDAFPLQQHIMKPYPGVQLKGTKKRIFNYRLSRSRRVVENAFGIISSVFRCLRKPLLLEPEKASKIVLACIYLHNFLRNSTTSKRSYTPPGTFDSEDKDTGEVLPGHWRLNNTNKSETSFLPLSKIARKPTSDAQTIRNEFSDYFTSNEGKLSWQEDY
uniref:Protein ALP1-like n=1 Tax=Diabrotica virgifera virgifera TaxID=50390 RepID=A0A6P7GR81_DIAVI